LVSNGLPKTKETIKFSRRISILCRVKTGIALLKQHNEKTRMPVLNTMYHVFISFWKEPVQATCEALIDTHQESLMEGQMEFAMSSAFHSCRQSFMCGTNLKKLNNDCISVTTKMVCLNCF
jgi:hypothetical protein